MQLVQRDVRDVRDARDVKVCAIGETDGWLLHPKSVRATIA